MIRVGVLTSSRADYGIYKPLLDLLKKDEDFALSIIAFGTHLSHFHGYTLDGIIKDGFEVNYTINSLLLHDDANSVASAFALTAMKFADLWKENASEFDIVLCLGDRYEMFGAVAAGIPFNIKFVHIHGGETTFGAIDNVYRHAITLASAYHFTSTENYSDRVRQITNGSSNIFTVGALSLDNLDSINLYEKEEFGKKYNIDVSRPSVLVTYHPETVSPEKNIENVQALSQVIRNLKKYTVIISLPNVDTFGNLIRQKWYELEREIGGRIVLIENFGTKGYFSSMEHCSFLLGNSSSGIIEAASFNKFVVNVGNRQEGRISGPNVFHCPAEYDKIMALIEKIESLQIYKGENIYYKGGAAKKMIEILKLINNNDRL